MSGPGLRIGLNLLVMLWAVVATVPAAAAKAKVGLPAPEFTVTTFDKAKVTLADVRGKVVVLNYWATWCGPCKAEMPMMDAYRRKLGKFGFEIYAITTEDSAPRRYLKELEQLLSFPLASKLRGKGYGLIGGSVPTNYVIDRNGVLRYAKAGAFDEHEFKMLILPLLREPAPEPRAVAAAGASTAR